jgi:hypothetical protein
MNDETYNGWTNYETWLVKLWIDNEESSQRYWAEAAQEVADNATSSLFLTREVEAARDLAERLRNEIEDGATDITGASGVYADLLTSALGSVDWREIAENMLEDVIPSDAVDSDAE